MEGVSTWVDRHGDEYCIISEEGGTGTGVSVGGGGVEWGRH